jgi:hypothetical protein
MLCELIALSCLVAHGDIQLPRQLRKAYAADDMLKQLEALHPNYYPRPQRREDGGPPPVKFTLVRRIPLQTSFPEVEAWQRKIAALLSTHRISLLDGATHILCTMDTGPARKVEVAIAERVSPPGA